MTRRVDANARAVDARERECGELRVRRKRERDARWRGRDANANDG